MSSARRRARELALQGIYQWQYTGEGAAQVLKNVAFAVVEVANALKNAFLQSAQQAAQVLKAVAYAVLDVAEALKNAFLENCSGGDR